MKGSYQEHKSVFDIIIIGGGITGSTTAIMLQKLGYKTLILEKTNLKIFKPGESLSPQCKGYFSSLDLCFDENEVIEYYGINSVWDTNETAISNFIYNPYGNGLAIDRTNLETKLINKSINLGCEVKLSHSIEECYYQNDIWYLNTGSKTGKQAFKANFVILATGRTLFQQLNRSKNIYFDKLISYSVLFENKNHNDHFLHVEALSNGWFYSNSIPGGKTIVSFLTDNDIGPKLSGDTEIFTEMIKQTNWHKKNSSHLPLDSTLIISDARTKWVQDQSGTGWLRLGDAAYTIDPLSGQGIMKNFEMTLMVIDSVNLFLNNNKNVHRDYHEYNRTNFLQYLAQRQLTYKRVERWSENIFWKRRN